MKKTSLNQKEPLTRAAVNQQAYQHLYALDANHFKDLAAFSAWQLIVGCRHPGAARELLLMEGADLLHDAFEVVLTGLLDPAVGRHPKELDVKDMKSFLKYLRNVIRSMRYKQARSAALKDRQIMLFPEVENYEDLVQLSPEEDVELRDLRDVFFIALRQELDDPEKYSAVLEEWHQHFFSITRLSELGLNSKDACKLRQKAQRLYLHLFEPAPMPPLIVDPFTL
jgi:hypothetical protein